MVSYALFSAAVMVGVDALAAITDLFHEVLSADPSGDRIVTLRLQLGIELLHDLVGIGFRHGRLFQQQR